MAPTSPTDSPSPLSAQTTTVYHRQIEGPLYAVIIPAAVFLLLGACFLIRWLVRRKEDASGPSSLESWPWRLLSACVEHRQVSSYGDGWGRHRRHSESSWWYDDSPAESKGKAATAAAAASAVSGHGSMEKRPQQMWEFLGRLDIDGDVGLSNPSFLQPEREDDDDDDDGRISPRTTTTPAISKTPASPTTALAAPEPAPTWEKLDPHSTPAKISGSRRIVAAFAPKDIDEAYQGRLQNKVEEPPPLRLPPESGRGDSYWEIGAKR